MKKGKFPIEQKDDKSRVHINEKWSLSEFLLFREEGYYDSRPNSLEDRLFHAEVFQEIYEYILKALLEGFELSDRENIEIEIEENEDIISYKLTFYNKKGKEKVIERFHRKISDEQFEREQKELQESVEKTLKAIK